MDAIILDGNLKSALVAVRSLGKKGIKVAVGAERSTAMALHSRYGTYSFVYPSPYTHHEAFINEIKAEAIRLGGKPLIYAFSDSTYLSLSLYRNELIDYATLIFPEQKSIDIAFDKAATYSLARVLNVPIIPTHVLETIEEVRVLTSTFSYPVVIKPRRSVTWKDGVGLFGSAEFVHTKDELIEKCRWYKDRLGELPLIQQFLFGEEYGVEMLADEGRIYARVTHHRIRSLSPNGGASVLKETLFEGDLKSLLESYAEILVRKLEWTGPIMVEFKVDTDTRQPYLMEINGRFWGSLPLSCISGVDMPYLYMQAIEDHMPNEIVSGKEGIVSRHFMGDVRNLLRVLFHKDSMRKLLYPSRRRAIYDFLKPPKGTVSDIWRWDDLLPGYMEIIDVIKKSIWK